MQASIAAQSKIRIMRRFIIACAIAFSLTTTPAFADPATDSLLKADRDLNTLAQKIGFAAAFAQGMGADPRKFDKGSPTGMGRAQVLHMLAGYGSDTHVSWTPVEAFVSKGGDFGYTWGRYLASFHDKNGHLISTRGRYLDVWQRGRDGKWRWIADIGTD